MVARRRGRRTATSAVVVLVGAGVATGLVLRDDPSPAESSAATATWTALPALPDRATTDVDGLVVLAGDAPAVAVVDRGATEHDPSTVTAWRWDGRAWHRVDRPLPVDRDQQVLAAGGACLAAPVRRAATVWCLSGDGWRRSGSAMFDADADRVARPTLSAFSADGPVRTAVRVAGSTGAGPPFDAAPRGRPVATAFAQTRGGAWRPLGPVASARDAPGGSLRPFAFGLAGTQCVVATLLGPSARRSPTVGGSCRDGADGSRVRRIPPLRVTRVAGPRAVAKRVAVNSDGAVGRGRDAFVGVDVFDGPATSWQVWRLRGRTWRRTPLADAPAGWSSQGSLHRVGPLVLALRFDQQGDLGTGLRSRIVVRGLTPDSRSGEVGGPLVEGTAHAPLYWDLAAGRRDVYAAATAPNAATGRNDVRVWTASRAALAAAAARW